MAMPAKPGTSAATSRRRASSPGPLHGLESTGARWLASAKLHLPMPSEAKWQYALELLRTLAVEYYQTMAKRLPESEAQTLAAWALFASGYRWMRSFTHDYEGEMASLGDLADVLKLLFRALDIETSAVIGSGEVLIANHRCPFLMEAVKRGMPRERLCALVCGRSRSLMEGLTQSLPMAVEYHPEAMMGRGQRVCIKRFSLSAARGQ